MATVLSKSCEYGLRASLYLAALDHDGYVSISTISEDLHISFPFLTKTFRKLNDAGFLESKGGVALTRPPPDAVSLHEIVVAIDGEDLFRECVLGLPDCGDATPCPLHDEWVDKRSEVETMFQNATLEELPNVRLSTLE